MKQIIILCIKIIGAIPIKVRQSLGRILGGLFGLIPSRETEIAKQQITWILGGSDNSRIVAELYKNLGQHVLESFNLEMDGPFLNDNFGLDDPDNVIQELLHPQQPAILLSAHIGNWDALAAYLIKIGVNLAALGRTSHNQYLQIALEFLRERHGVKTMRRGSQADTLQMLKFLKKNGVLGALVDQDLHAESIWLNFMGQPAKSPVSLIELGLRIDAKFYTCFNIRNDNKMTLKLRSVKQATTAFRVLEIFNDELEKSIRSHPEQWVWIHKRWRSPNANLTYSTKQYLEFLNHELTKAG